jgi:hypothetical protein
MANLHWKIVYENVIFKDCKFQGYEQIRTVTSRTTALCKAQQKKKNFLQ